MNHKHEWVVYSTAMKERWLMLQCVECGAMATVDDPTKEEWGQCVPCPVQAVPMDRRSTSSCPARAAMPSLRRPNREKRCYDCACPPKFLVTGAGIRALPCRDRQAGEVLTKEDVAELEQLAELVTKFDLCSRLFPMFIHSYQDRHGQRADRGGEAGRRQNRGDRQDGAALLPAGRGECADGVRQGVRAVMNIFSVSIRKMRSLLYKPRFAGYYPRRWAIL